MELTREPTEQELMLANEHLGNFLDEVCPPDQDAGVNYRDDIKVAAQAMIYVSMIMQVGGVIG